MRSLKRPVSVHRALSLSLGAVVPIKRIERVSLLSALGRVAAESVVSKVSVPPFSGSLVDGYAVRAKDLPGASPSSPVHLRVGATVFAGDGPTERLRKGWCAKVATGAMLPIGADSVLIAEEADVRRGELRITAPVRAGQNTSRRGEDVAPGTRLVSEGEVMTTGRIAAVAAVGTQRIEAYCRPLVGIVPTGNELTELGTRLQPGHIFNTNSYALSSIVAANGGEARQLGIARDTVEDLRDRVRRNPDCDMLLFSGGSSVGERDLMRGLLRREGRVLYHGVAMRPGRPMLFGRIGRQLVFGLPGFSSSCIATACVFVVPTLRKMARLPPVSQKPVAAFLSRRVASDAKSSRFVPVRLEGCVAHPIPRDSGVVKGISGADGYVLVPRGVSDLKKGKKVSVRLL